MGSNRKERRRQIYFALLFAPLIIVSFVLVLFALLWRLPEQSPNRLLYWAMAVYTAAYYIGTNKFAYCNIRELGIKRIRFCEVFLLIMRWAHFTTAVIVAYYSVFLGRQCPPGVIVLLAVLLLNGLFQSFSRSSFRIFPSCLLSLAAVLQFLVITGVSYKCYPEKMWRLIDSTQLADYLNNSPPIFTRSAVIVVIAPLFLAVARYLINKYRAQVGENTLKLTRRRLLSHQWYNPKTVVNDNSNVWIAAGMVLLCLFSVLLNLPSKKRSETILVTRIAVDTIYNTTVDTMKAGKFDVQIEAVFDHVSLLKDGGENLQPSAEIDFLEYLSIFASAVAIAGIVWLFEVRENELLRCEHYYLKYYAPMMSNLCVEGLSRKERKWKWVQKLKKSGICNKIGDKLDAIRVHLTRRMYGAPRDEKALRWLRDYCQVLGHLFSSGSEIRSENEDAHEINKVIGEIGEGIQEPKTKSIVLTEMMYAFRKAQRQSQTEVKQAKKSEKKEEKEPEAEKQKTATEGESLFADAIKQFVDKAADKDCCMMLAGLKAAQNMMQNAFQEIKKDFNLGRQTYSPNELAVIVNVDVLYRITRRQGKSKCVFSWICGEDNCGCGSGQDKLDLRTLLLIYPFLGISSIAERCPKEASESIYWYRLVKKVVVEYFIQCAKLNEKPNEAVVNKLKELWKANDERKNDIEKIYMILHEIISGQERDVKRAILAAIRDFAADFSRKMRELSIVQENQLEVDEKEKVHPQIDAVLMSLDDKNKQHRTGQQEYNIRNYIDGFIEIIQSTMK